MSKALKVTNPVPGTLVYRPYQPLKIGRVLEVLENQETAGGRRCQCLRVEWMDGQTVFWPTSWFNSLDALIEEHEDKLFGHKTRRAAAVEKWKLNGNPTI